MLFILHSPLYLQPSPTSTTTTLRLECPLYSQSRCLSVCGLKLYPESLVALQDVSTARRLAVLAELGTIQGAAMTPKKF